MPFKPIQIVINAKDNASAVFGRLEGKIKAVGIAVAGYFGIRAFAGGVQGAADLEAAMSRVKAATDGTAEEMQALTKAAQSAGSSTKYTSVEAAGALENLAKAGLSAGDAIKALPAVLALAQAGDVGLAEASEYVTKAVMGMGLAFDDAARVSDVLAKGANATNTSVEGLAQALSYAAPVANTLGMSLESTVAIIGKFADAGIDASRAGTALNSILSQFANPASAFRKELGAAGIVTEDFDEALRQLAARGPAGAKAINAVGLEAGPALRALLNQGMGALDELTEKLRNAEGSAAAAAKTMQDNFSGSVLGLRSVWQSAVEVLNTPVLPVLRKGVDELTAAIRRSIDDGTVAKFGQTLSVAFENALKYFRAFAANVNFDAVILRLQVFASETQEVLQRIGTYATNAGHSVQLAWGVMTAGTNAVLTAIYGIGAVFSEVASKVMSGVAMLRQGLASISFGGLSESFRLAAEDARQSAEAFGEVAQAFRDKAAEALGDTAEAAQLARDGWDGLTQAAEPAVAAAQQVSTALNEVTQAQQQQAQASQALIKQQEQKAKSDEAARGAISALRSEYDSLIKGGNLQAAAQKLLEIDRAQQALAKSAPQVVDAAALMEQAYKDLGLKTNAELQEAATKARAAFEVLAKDGTQSPQRIADAWKVMAERVIEANGGVAPSWLKVDAAARQYEVTVDQAGKSVVSTEKATLQATGNMAKGYERLGRAAEDAGRRIRNQQQQQPEPGSKPGSDTPPAPSGVPGQKTPGGKPIPKDATEEEAERLRKAQRQGKWVYDRELEKVQERIRKAEDEQRRQSERDELERQNQARREQLANADTGPSNRDLLAEMRQQPTGQPQPEQQQGWGAQQVQQIIRHEIALPGGDVLGINVADSASSDALNALFEQLERGAQMAGGRF